MLDSLPAEKRGKVYLFNSFFYDKLANKAYDGDLVVADVTSAKPLPDTVEWPAYQSVRKWTKSANIFQKEYIIVPINEQCVFYRVQADKSCHWYLAIIYNPSAILRERKPTSGPSAAPSPHHMENLPGPLSASLVAEPALESPARGVGDVSMDVMEGNYGEGDQDIITPSPDLSESSNKTPGYSNASSKDTIIARPKINDDDDLRDFESDQGDHHPSDDDHDLSSKAGNLSLGEIGAITNPSELAMLQQSRSRVARRTRDSPGADALAKKSENSRPLPREDYKIWQSDQ